MPPKFSIILPTHKRPQWLPHALASVKAQTFSDWECIVINDGACPETRAILDDETDKRIVVVTAKNATGSAAAARNLGALQASGEFLIFLDDDDRFLPNTLQVISDYLSAGRIVDMFMPSLKIVVGNDENINVSIKRYASWPDFYFSSTYDAKREHIWSASRFRTNGLTIRRLVFQKLNGFNPHYRVSEDRDLTLRALFDGASFAATSEVLVSVYEHSGERLSVSDSGQQLESDERLLSEHQQFFNLYPEIKAYFLDRLVGQCKKAERLDLAKYYSKCSLKSRPFNLRALRRYIILNIRY